MSRGSRTNPFEQEKRTRNFGRPKMGCCDCHLYGWSHLRSVCGGQIEMQRAAVTTPAHDMVEELTCITAPSELTRGSPRLDDRCIVQYSKQFGGGGNTNNENPFVVWCLVSRFNLLTRARYSNTLFLYPVCYNMQSSQLERM